MVLKLGSTGEDVKSLQTKLGIGADGSFGPGTERALKAWQQANGLTADGIAGTATLAKLEGEEVKVVIPASGDLNLTGLKGHVPDAVISQIPETAAKFGIDTPLKLAHFLSQCAHESGGFTVVYENLNYSAAGLNNTFKKYFPTLESAKPYDRNKEKIANKVYANRMGNSNEASGEGFKFRGRGYIQLTGKDNYTAFSKSIGVDVISNPDLVATVYPLLSAAWFFSKNCLKKCVDASDTTVTSVTKCVNGGTTGLDDRLKHFKEFYNALT
jgi:putative chitinase